VEIRGVSNVLQHLQVGILKSHWKCGALLWECWALLWKCGARRHFQESPRFSMKLRALLCRYRALLCRYRALSCRYRALLCKYRAFFGIYLQIGILKSHLASQFQRLCTMTAEVTFDKAYL